jgi:hypothetical protein
MAGLLLAWRPLLELFNHFKGSSARTVSQNRLAVAPVVDPLNRVLQAGPPAAYRTELSADHVSHL